MMGRMSLLSGFRGSRSVSILPEMPMYLLDRHCYATLVQFMKAVPLKNLWCTLGMQILERFFADKLKVLQARAEAEKEHMLLFNFFLRWVPLRCHTCDPCDLRFMMLFLLCCPLQSHAIGTKLVHQCGESYYWCSSRAFLRGLVDWNPSYFDFSVRHGCHVAGVWCVFPASSPAQHSHLMLEGYSSAY